MEHERLWNEVRIQSSLPVKNRLVIDVSQLIHNLLAHKIQHMGTIGCIAISPYVCDYASYRRGERLHRL